jgi:hypothetical protein
MKINTKQIIAAIALTGAFGGANAATLLLNDADFPTDLGSNPTAANNYAVSHTPGAFSDEFTFNLTSVSDTVSSAVSLFLPGLNGGPASYETTGGTLSLLRDTDNNGVGGADTVLGSVAFGSSNGVLAVLNVNPGSYFWKITGNATGTLGAAYLYSSNTSAVATPPVPEPETYALMLAGLGLIGFIGRRRLNKSAALLSFA